MLCSWNWKGELSGRLPQVTRVCQLSHAFFRAIEFIFYKWGFQSSKDNAPKFCEVRSPYQPSPIWATLTWACCKSWTWKFKALHLLLCPCLLWAWGWIMRMMAEEDGRVLLQQIYFWQCPCWELTFANIYSTFDWTLKTKIPTEQAEPSGGHPVLSVCAYLWETGQDLPLFSGKVGAILPLKMGLKTQFLL